MKNIAIIPARSGSKGLADKNIRPFCGKPLLAYSIEAALASNCFAEVYVSTDSGKYAEIAGQYGANTPFLRPAQLSGDTASTWEVIKDALQKYKALGKSFDSVMVLQPTSPLRTAADIVKAYALFEENKADFVVSVCETEHSPLWANILPADNSMQNFLSKELLDVARQDLPLYYRINGAIYLVGTDYLWKQPDLYAGRSFALKMETQRSADIDTEVDFLAAEFLYQFYQKNIKK